MVAIYATLTFLATFLAALAAVAVSWGLLRRGDLDPDGTRPENTGLFTVPDLLKSDTLSTISGWDHLLARLNFVAGLQRRVQEADLTWSAGRVIAMVLLLGAITLALGSSIEWFPTWAALLAAGAGGWLPLWYLQRRRTQRRRRFAENFPDALDGLCSALRAGHPFVAALHSISLEYPEPLAAEMRRTFEERKLGLPLEQALDNLAQRVPLLEVRLFAAAIQLQARTGGNLTEVLGRLAEAMRENEALHGEIRAIASHGKLTGWVLTLLPFAIVLAMTAMNPHYFTSLLNHPYGKHLIFAALACLVLAHVVIRKIVEIEI